jgi:heptaprenyl diphosphate synthase
MLRPALLVIGSRFGRTPEAKHIDGLAAAIELLHIATLIHDDVLDEAELRRGAPTLHTQFGHKDAVLAGDWLLSRCFSLAAESAGPDNARALARLIGAICSAEIGQDLAKFRYSGSERRYLRTIAGKTAALFSLALHAGATEAKTQARTVQTLRRAGYDVGLAFQIIDDILDYESSENIMGKPVGKDIREGLCTLPLVHALKADPAGMGALLDGATRSGGRMDDASVAAIVARTAELGGVERARETARRFTARALAEMTRLPEGEAQSELVALTERLLQRKY